MAGEGHKGMRLISCRGHMKCNGRLGGFFFFFLLHHGAMGVYVFIAWLMGILSATGFSMSLPCV